MGNDVTGGFLYETSYAEGNATHAEDHIIKMGNDVTGGFLYETSYAEGNATHAEENAERMCGSIARPCFNVSQIRKRSVTVYH